MKIGIDASRVTDKPTGVEVFSEEILKAFLKNNLLKNSEVILYASPFSNLEKLGQLSENYSVHKINNKRLWTHMGLGIRMLKKEADVLFVPSHVLPVFLPQKSVVVIHDVGFKRFPENYAAKQVRYLDWSTKFALKNSDVVIVPSRATKQEIEHFYNDVKAKIKVVYHGYSPVSQSRDGESQDSFLFVGRIEQRKNLQNMVAAFHKIRKKHSQMKFKIAGGLGFDGQKIINEIKSGGVEYLGYISEEEKNNLYKSARAFCFVTKYEGFGLPILEAMDSGMPVITSNTYASAEIAGDAALKINPEDVGAMARAMEEVISNNDLKKNLVAKGYKRAQEFSWDKTASKIADMLLEL